MTGAVVRNAQLEALTHRRVKVGQSRLDGRCGYAQMLRTHGVEALSSITHSSSASNPHILNDGRHRGQGGGDVQAGTRQGLGKLAGGQILVTQVDSSQHTDMLAGADEPACRPSAHSCRGAQRPAGSKSGRRSPRPKAAASAARMRAAARPSPYGLAALAMAP